MKKWDGKPTSVLDAWIRELQGKMITNGGSSRRIAAPVSGGQCERCARWSERANLTPDPMRRNSNNSSLFSQEVAVINWKCIGKCGIWAGHKW